MLYLAFRNLLCGALVLFLSTGLAFGQTTSKFEIVSVRFVERVEGVTSSWAAKDPSKTRAALVLIKATLIDDEPIWTPDLVLAYKRSGEIDRSRCLGFGLGGVDSADGGPWMLGDYVKSAVRRDGARESPVLRANRDRIVVRSAQNRGLDLVPGQPVAADNGPRRRRHAARFARFSCGNDLADRRLALAVAGMARFAGRAGRRYRAQRPSRSSGVPDERGVSGVRAFLLAAAARRCTDALRDHAQAGRMPFLSYNSQSPGFFLRFDASSSGFAAAYMTQSHMPLAMPASANTWPAVKSLKPGSTHLWR